MAYESVTPGGSQVNADLYNQYMQFIMQQQTQGMPAPSYDEWFKSIQTPAPLAPQSMMPKGLLPLGMPMGRGLLG